MNDLLRPLRAAVVSVVGLTVICGVLYPALVLGIGTVAAPHQANGSLITHNGTVIGSSLLGQSFTDAEGKALPQYLQGRPSAAGDAGYDGASSSGTNYGPENEDLIASIRELKAEIAQREGVAEDQIPPDAVTSSSSGLDPHISMAYAEIQVPRLAKERGISEDEVRAIIAQHTTGRAAGLIGEERVDVLAVNMALDSRKA